MSLDFKEAQVIAKKLNEEENLPHFTFITHFIENAGQNPKVDSQAYNIILNTRNSVDDLLLSLSLGIYKLYNEPSNGEAFVHLSEAIFYSDKAKDVAFKKLAYLFILELYSQEIIQTSDDYLKYLVEYRAIIDSEEELAWYHIHYLAYITKTVAVDNVVQLYFRAYDAFQSHFESCILNDRLMAYYFFNQALFMEFKGEEFFLQAKESYEKTIQFTQEFTFLRYLKFTSYIHLCLIESSTGQLLNAKQNLENAKRYWNKSDSVRSMFIQNRFSAIYYYSKIHQYDSAYEFLKRAEMNEAELDFRKNTLKISELNVKLRTADKEKDLIQKSAQLKEKDKWLWTVVVLTTILATLAIGLTMALRNIRSKNLKIETLLRELHHRVKNNLQVISSLLSLQSLKLKDEAAKKAVSEGQERVRAMSLIHQRLYQDEQAISLNIKDYLNDLVKELTQSYGFQQKGEVRLEIVDKHMDADTALPLGLIVNELVSNALKYGLNHSNDPLLELKLKFESNKSYELFIHDNGPGLPKNFKIEQVGSFGMKLVTLLVKQLNGSLSLINTGGLTYIVRF